MASLGADLTSSDANESYITCSKLNINSTVQDIEENNVLPLQEPVHNDNHDASVGAATALSLLCPTIGNSNSQHLNGSHMKCCYDHTYCHFLDHFNDPILDDAVIYADDTPFQYKTENSSFVAPANTSDSSYHTWK